jgi:hypothetical protein
MSDPFFMPDDEKAEIIAAMHDLCDLHHPLRQGLIDPDTIRRLLRARRDAAKAGAETLLFPSPQDRLDVIMLLPLMRVVHRHVPTDPPLPLPVGDDPTDAEVEAILDWLILMKDRDTDL